MTIVGMCIAASLIAAVVAPWFGELTHVWLVDANYSHGLLVPLISAGIAWFAWRKNGHTAFGNVTRRDLCMGSAEIVFALLLNFGAWMIGNLLLAVLALVALIRGSLLILGGRPANRRFGFAALFLIFMAPLPVAWYQWAAGGLQHVVAEVSTAMLRLSGVAVFDEGAHLHLPGYTMEVGAACSGLGQLTAFLALGALAAYASDCRTWCRAALLFAAIPVAVAANCLRVALTGWILIGFGAGAADGVFHTLEGMATVAVGAALLAGVAWALAQCDRSLGAATVRRQVGNATFGEKQPALALGCEEARA